MRILLVTHQFSDPFSGVGTYARSLAYGLNSNGVNVHILCPSSQCVDDGPFEFTGTRELTGWDSHARWIHASRIFAQSIRRIGPCDVIHFLDARECLFRPRTTVPCVGTVHDYYFARPLLYWKRRSFFPDWLKRFAYSCVVRVLEPLALRRCHHLIMNSRATADEISSAYAISRNMMSTVYIGLDREVEQLSTARRRKRPAILFVGGNPYRKGLPRLLKAMSDVNREIPAELWIVGSTLTPYLKRMVESLGIESMVSVHPHVDRHDLSDLYAGATCLAIPGLTEAFGLVFLEAFAHGCPVIGPRHGGSSEIIHDGINGFLVDSDNDMDLTQKLFRILREPGLTDKFSAQGRKALESFTEERMIQKTMAIYTRAISGNL